MIRVLMLDLGGTLVSENPLQVLPGVPQALAALNGLATASGAPLAVCLVSNYRPTAEEVAATFQQYLGLLTNLGLTAYFQPVNQRVTLSTHTATWKPDRRVFELAVQRLGITASLDECLLITEDAGHIAAARSYGMKALRFGVDFQDWTAAPAAVANLLTLSQ